MNFKVDESLINMIKNTHLQVIHRKKKVWTIKGKKSMITLHPRSNHLIKWNKFQKQEGIQIDLSEYLYQSK